MHQQNCIYQDNLYHNPPDALSDYQSFRKVENEQLQHKMCI